MIAKDLEKFADKHWTKTVEDCATEKEKRGRNPKPVSEISRSDKSKPETALVKSDLEMFDFDCVVEATFPGEKCKSADAFYAGRADAFGDNKDIRDKLQRNERKQICFYLIEFKRDEGKAKKRDNSKGLCKYLQEKGFPENVCPKETLKREFYQKLERMDKTECPLVKELTGESHFCADCSLLSEQRKRREEELCASVRLKAIESYMVLARTVFTHPECADGKSRKLIYCVVIGEPYVVHTTERLNVFNNEDTTWSDRLKDALDRLKRKIPDPKEPDVPKPYLYDDIRVITPRRFDMQADNLLSPKKGT